MVQVLRPIVSLGTQACRWDALRGVFLRDPSPYLREFRRKPRKTPNGQVDKRDRGMNLAPPIYQILSEATGGVKDGQFDIHALPGIIGVASGSPNYYTPWSATCTGICSFIICIFDYVCNYLCFSCLSIGNKLFSTNYAKYRNLKRKFLLAKEK